MSRPTFQLKRPLGRSYRVDLGDTRRTKEALQRLGYYETPDYGMTDYPDEPMFKGIESFQNDNDLPITGIVRPNDDTSERLRHHLGRLPSVDGGGHLWRYLLGIEDYPPTEILNIVGDVGEGRRNDPVDVQNTRRALSWAGFLPAAPHGADETVPDENLFTAIRNFQQAKGLEVDGWMHPGGETEHYLGGEIEPTIKAWQAANQNDQSAANDDGNVQVAQAGGTDLPISAIPPGAATLTGAALLEMMRRGALPVGAENWDNDSNSERTSITPPMPPAPPSEPSKEEQGHKEEFPVSPPFNEIDLSHPLPDDVPPGIFIFPMPSEDLTEAGQIQERKGNEATKKELDEIRDGILRANPGWDHIAGGRSAKDGSEMPEYHVRGPGQNFGDVHTGGAYADLTFISPNGTLIHVQTVDVDRNGKPKLRELEAAERIRRLDPGSNIILIPKRAQLDKIFGPKP